ncbi:hypothetical protein Mal48_00120 [Thalassoglobus polymorphus]|uniref:Uncharacterized protein n=1 Tax=Thalassoglobus polymorphus TaxID=2527994 RepID=A0A517QGQ5_9PLAN|nr:hypothetical protein Mal48_00120 [Thalassoglobus polymorphus]
MSHIPWTPLTSHDETGLEDRFDKYDGAQRLFETESSQRKESPQALQSLHANHLFPSPWQLQHNPTFMLTHNPMQ